MNTPTKKQLAKWIAAWIKRGYTVRCAPKSVEDEFHEWRRIARVGKPGKPSVCLQVVLGGISPDFDWLVF